jgi:hypothetical protein
MVDFAARRLDLNGASITVWHPGGGTSRVVMWLKELARPGGLELSAEDGGAFRQRFDSEGLRVIGYRFNTDCWRAEAPGHPTLQACDEIIAYLVQALRPGTHVSRGGS